MTESKTTKSRFITRTKLYSLESLTSTIVTPHGGLKLVHDSKPNQFQSVVALRKIVAYHLCIVVPKIETLKN